MREEIFIPKMGANIDKVIIGKIFVKEGDSVKKGQPILEAVSFKSSFDIEATKDGRVVELNCKDGEERNVLDVVGFIEDEFVPLQKVENIKATPAARKLAKESGVDLQDLKTDSVIKEEDVLSVIYANNTLREPIGFRKKAEINQLEKSREYLSSSVTIQVATSALNSFLERYNSEHNTTISKSEFIAHNTGKILQTFWKLNSYYSKEHLVKNKSINIGQAVNFNHELFVPIVKNSNELSLEEFSRKSKENIFSIVSGNINPGSLNCGTFTISDLSAKGVYTFSPIVNANQAAILGISGEFDSIKFDEGKILPEKKMNLILCFDHRVCDGLYVAEFLFEIKKKIELG
jgi:pyruvate dehydrogenase E2 component (dihydrolipoamide acetyltransferase)